MESSIFGNPGCLIDQMYRDGGMKADNFPFFIFNDLKNSFFCPLGIIGLQKKFCKLDRFTEPDTAMTESTIGFLKETGKWGVV